MSKTGVYAKKIIIIMVLTVCTFMLASCAKSPDEVKLASTKEIRTYAKLHYGRASSYEAAEGENSRTVTFTDSEYGFSYTVESYAMELGIDGSTFGYTENKVSDFDQNYYKALYAIAEEEFGTQYDMDYGYCWDDGYCCAVYHVNADDAESVTEQIGSCLKKLDTRNYYGDSEACVEAYLGEKENYIGSWHIADGKYYCYADENIEQMTNLAEAWVNNSAADSDKKKIKFLYWEQMDVSEVPDIDNWELVNHTMDDGTLVTLYWFDIDGEKHFIADIKVWNVGDVNYSDMITDNRSTD